MNMSYASLDEEPERFGKFVLARKLRAGGMGLLASAVDSETGQLVVIKRSAKTSAEELSRFHDEIELSRSLGEHPNLVRYVEAGRVDEVDYLALELLAGQDLDILIERAGRMGKRITVPLAASIVLPICKALEYAHSRQIGFVHRDIKPANIVVCYDGSVKLIDYGGALSIHKRNKTQVGHVFGTVGYWSPEQKKGLPATERSDLFSVAAVFQFLLAGISNYGEGEDNNSKEALAARLKPLVPDLPRPVLTWLWRALQTQPSRRYESAAEMSAALAAATPVASTAELSAFVSHLFTVERSDDEELDEWRKRFSKPQRHAAEKTAVLLRAVGPESEQQAPARRSRAWIVIVSCVALVASGGAILWQRRAPSIPAPSPPLPTITSPTRPPEPSLTTPIQAPVVTPQQTPVKASIPTSPIKQLGNAQTLKRVQEARALIRQDKNETARQLLAELENEPAVRGQVKVALAELAYSEGEYDRVIALATQATRLGVKADAYQIRANAELKAGLVERAAQDFGRVLAIDPKNRDARQGLTVAQQQLKKGAP